MSFKFLRIGIIGRGFVGGAIERFYHERSKMSVLSYDIQDEPATGVDLNTGYSVIVKHGDIIYLCVPTPMDKNGRCYTGIVELAVAVLNQYAKQHNKLPIVLIKSTMTPGTTEKMQKENPHLILVTNPEFLTERNAYEDMCSAKKHVFGIADPKNNPIQENLQELHEKLWPECEVGFVSSREAELIKYTINSYLAVKVTFANHIYNLCQALGIDYSAFIRTVIHTDSRIGSSHLQVPGPDGHLGFGLSCIPKDLNGMIELFKDNDVDPGILVSTKRYNNCVRPEQDWKELVGRAVMAKEE